MRLVLGSTSKARAELLKQLRLNFKLASPTFDERSLPYKGDPIDYCKELALLKNRSICSKDPQDALITCDTIVWCKNRVLNKPQSYQEAASMLEFLSGSTHQVFSGLSVYYQGEYKTSHEATTVEFNTLCSKQINLFLQDPLYIQRSGAYTVTGIGALLVKSIQGSYENVIGLPINSLESLLNQWNISLWDHFI